MVDDVPPWIRPIVFPESWYLREKAGMTSTRLAKFMAASLLP